MLNTAPHKLIHTLIPVLLCSALIACGGGGGSSSAQSTSTADSTVSTSTAKLSLTAHSDNTLMVNTSLTTERNASVVIAFSSANTEAHSTSNSALGLSHTSTAIGLRADTSYSFTAIISYEDGTVEQTAAETIVTGSLPSNAPATELVTKTAASEGGITFFAGSSDETDAKFWGVDEDGYIVWYLHDNSLPMPAEPSIRSLDDGRLMLNLQQQVRIIDTLGNTLTTYDIPSYHHDVILLDNGNLLALTNTDRTNSAGTVVKEDVIKEYDSSGAEVWSWSSFDNLDPLRFPGTLSTRVSGGAADWTHANALFYMSHDDSILMSVRSQSWLVNIDHATGDVLWIMGDGTGADAKLDGKFFTLNSGSWMANQHAAMMDELGNILVYDNRNESGGAASNSRAARYSINTSAMTAEQNRESIAPKYTSSLGDIDELDGNNLMFCACGPEGNAGDANRDAHIVEVSADSPSTVVWEMKVPGLTLYRAERMSWSKFLGSTAVSVATPEPDESSNSLDTANCSEASDFIDSNNPDNYVAYQVDGLSNAERFADASLAPELNISCDADTLYVTSNGATNFDWQRLNGVSPVAETDKYQWTLPRNPTLAAIEDRLSIPILGPAAITATGLQIFGPNENGADNYADPFLDGLLNYCGGHTIDYHFHSFPECFFNWQTAGGAASLLPDNTPGVVVGYALDGFPILAPWECDDASCTNVIEVNSSYRYEGTGVFAGENAWDAHVYYEGDSPLDQCNGMLRPDGSYAYYATKTWPYYMACYRGDTSLIGDNNNLWNIP